MPSSRKSIFPLLEKIRTGALNAQDLAAAYGSGMARPVTSGSDVRAALPGLSGGSSATAPNVNVQGHSLKALFVGVTEQDVRRINEEEMPDLVRKIVRGMKAELGAT